MASMLRELSASDRNFLMVAGNINDPMTITSLCRIFNDSTPELRNVLSSYCNVIIECAHCRNLFRSFVPYLYHRENICSSISQSSRRDEFLSSLRLRSEQPVIEINPNEVSIATKSVVERKQTVRQNYNSRKRVSKKKLKRPPSKSKTTAKDLKFRTSKNVTFAEPEATVATISPSIVVSPYVSLSRLDPNVISSYMRSAETSNGGLSALSDTNTSPISQTTSPIPDIKNTSEEEDSDPLSSEIEIKPLTNHTYPLRCPRKDSSTANRTFPIMNGRGNDHSMEHESVDRMRRAIVGQIFRPNLNPKSITTIEDIRKNLMASMLKKHNSP